MLEKYLGCECTCLNHIAVMSYFPPNDGEKVDEEDNVIYFRVRAENNLDRIMPPFSINPCDWPYDFGDYFRFHILKRIPIAICYFFNPSYTKKHGILDCFDFKDKDLPEMKEFLSHLIDKGNKEITLDNHIEKIIDQHIFYLYNERWRLGFTIWRIDTDLPWELGWEIQFIPRKIFGRIKYALKYIFGKICIEQEFEINEEIAKKMKNLITVVERINNERTKSKN